MNPLSVCGFSDWVLIAASHPADHMKCAGIRERLLGLAAKVKPAALGAAEKLKPAVDVLKKDIDESLEHSPVEAFGEIQRRLQSRAGELIGKGFQRENEQVGKVVSRARSAMGVPETPLTAAGTQNLQGEVKEMLRSHGVRGTPAVEMPATEPLVFARSQPAMFGVPGKVTTGTKSFFSGKPVTEEAARGVAYHEAGHQVVSEKLRQLSEKLTGTPHVAGAAQLAENLLFGGSESIGAFAGRLSADPARAARIAKGTTIAAQAPRLVDEALADAYAVAHARSQGKAIDPLSLGAAQASYPVAALRQAMAAGAKAKAHALKQSK
jgi:hypothetical protein